MRIGGLVERLVAASAARPWAVLATAIALVAAALAFAGDRFAMTTDATALISPDVPWRQAERRFDAVFPGQGDVTLAVLDGATPELAEAGAAALAGRLSRDTARFARVTRPDGGAFFAKEGLLYASPAEVSAATARMIEAQPFLGPLAADPGLRGLATALGTMLDGVQQGAAPLSRIAAPLHALADAFETRGAGKPAFFSWQRLLGGGGPLAAPARRLVLVSPRLDYGALMPGEASSDAIRAAAAALKLDPSHGVTVRLTGSVPLSDEEFASLAQRAWLVGGVMLAAMLAMLWLATRSWRMVAAIMLTTLAGLAVTAALGLALVGRFNLISIAFIPLFVGLGVDFGIQLGVRTQAERRQFDPAHPELVERGETGLRRAQPEREGGRLADALGSASRALGPSLMLAAGAVCLGFLAFLPTDYVGVSELGLIAGIGMIVALLASATLFPAFVVLFRPGMPSSEMGWRAMAPLDAFLVRRRKLVLGAFALAVLLSVALLPLVRFDFNPLHLRDTRGEAMATLADLTRDPDRSPNLIDIVTPNLAAADVLARRLAALPEVARATTLDGFVPAEQPAKLTAIGDARALLDLTLDPIMAGPPPTDPELAQALRETATKLRGAANGNAPEAGDARRLAAAFERLAHGTPRARAEANAMIARPLAVMLDQLRASLAAEPVSRATLPSDLVRDWIAPDGRARVQVAPKGDGSDNAVIARFAEAVTKLAPDATGPPISTRGAAATIARAFIEAGILAFALVSLLLAVVLRSLRETLFTLAPVILSIFLTLLSCVTIGQSINFANIIAFPLLFGVGVAFHIYFVMAWRGGATDLLQSSLAHAVLFSALATGSAFGALWLSDHPGTASMGKILMISLAWTLVCALIFEPALLGPARQGKPSRTRSSPARGGRGAER